MHTVLIADIGATTSRYAVVGLDGRPDRVVTLANDTVSGVDGGIARYLELSKVRPTAAVLGIAGPIDGDAIALTNRDWRFKLGDLASRFGLSSVRAINDFEAVAWSLELVGDGDVRTLGPTAGDAHGAKVVFGPGTGLGVAALVPTVSGWHVVATEGGHVLFGPCCDEEEPVFARLRRECGSVSAETVLSGPGLERLHRALHGPGEPLTAEVIAKCARDGQGPACATVDLFVRLLGRFAGDVALTFKATGGIYIAGGVAQRIQQLLDAEAFRQAFEAHPPYQHLLRAIPTTLITLEQPGLLGCAVVAAHMLQPAE
jgi:glucokinase